MNSCCRAGRVGIGCEDDALEDSQVAMLDAEGVTEDTSGTENVDKKEGATKFGLPCREATGLAIGAGTGGKPTPEEAKAEA